ncbi:MAG: elaC [Chlorobi bacterium]|nr:elaC [Chlorobiota bacterium]
MMLTLHGTGAGTPGGDRMASALTATFSDGSLVLFDAGEGCARAMLRDRIDLSAISTVAISHMHADHWTGFPALVMAWSLAKRTNPVSVYVPPGTADFFESLPARCYSFRERLGFELTFHQLAGFSMPDGWRVEIIPTTHLNSVRELAQRYSMPPTAFGYLLLNGERRIVLSQDIGGEEDLRPHLDGAELLVCESAHVDPAAVLEMAQAAGVRHVVFTHVPPADARFPVGFDGIAWDVATDGLRIGL